MAPAANPAAPVRAVRALRAEAGVRLARPRAERRLAAIGRSGRRIVAGPWMGEIGYEVLYWIPMLRWLAEHHGIGPERIVAVSRGGVASWYQGLAGSYVELLDHFEPEELRRWFMGRAAATSTDKQRAPGEAEEEFLRRAAPELGDEPFELLHPSVIYDLFESFWQWRRSRHSLARVLDRAIYRPLRPEPDEPLPGLPDDYVAVKAYFRDTFPDDQDNRAFLALLLERLTAGGEVVLLSTGLSIDDHTDFEPAQAARIHDAAGLMSGSDNLAVQSRVIRHASALFTTYGGFAYLGPFLGTPTFAFSSIDGVNPLHLDVMERAHRELGAQGHDSRLTWAMTRELLALDAVAGG